MDPKIVLRASWGSLGLLSGALGDLLGASLSLQIDQQGLTTIELATFGALFGLFWSLLVASSGSIFFESCRLFVCLGLLGRISGLQADPPTLGNHDINERISTIMKHQRFRSEDGPASVLGLSWASFGCSWGSLGTPFGPRDRPQRAATS